MKQQKTLYPSDSTPKSFLTTGLLGPNSFSLEYNSTKLLKVLNQQNLLAYQFVMEKVKNAIEKQNKTVGCILNASAPTLIAM